jgi:hypothetical protein
MLNRCSAKVTRRSFELPLPNSLSCKVLGADAVAACVISVIRICLASYHS